MTLRTLFFAVTLCAAPVLAADGGSDGGGDDTPDASVGNGGSEQMTQEGDETGPNGVCALTRDCERGFTCVNGTCRYAGFRQATQGCSAVPGVVLVAAAAALLLRRRR